MCGHVTNSRTIEVIVGAGAFEKQSDGGHFEGFWHHSTTLLWNLFNQFTFHWSRLLSYYAASVFSANDPVVDVAFDQGLVTNGAPQIKVHSLIVCLTQWSCCGHACVTFVGCPGGTWGDCVWTSVEGWVSCEGVTPNECPAPSVRLLVAVGLESVTMGTTIRVNPVDAWRGWGYF